jgi:hypothetical protein
MLTNADQMHRAVTARTDQAHTKPERAEQPRDDIEGMLDLRAHYRRSTPAVSSVIFFIAADLDPGIASSTIHTINNIIRQLIQSFPGTCDRFFSATHSDAMRAPRKPDLSLCMDSSGQTKLDNGTSVGLAVKACRFDLLNSTASHRP